MSFFDSRVVLEVLSQKLNSRLSVLKRGEHGYEGKKEEKREKKGEKRERGRKRVRQGGARVRGEFFLLLQAFQVSSKWNQEREAKENPRNK